ncbi:MAG: reverse gyrase [Thermoprotei archaeon]|nr:MAG: reverse gyrase [Thermoprotei archaeon]
MPYAKFKNLCPLCGGVIDSDRLEMGLVCKKCSAKLSRREKSIQASTLNRMLLREIESDFRELNLFFEKSIGASMWSAQRMWAKRILSGRSFSMIAPTGSGKTVFGILISLFLARRGNKVLFILPTSILVEQVYEKMKIFNDKLGLGVNIISYHTFLTKKEKDRIKDDISLKEYDVLIISSSFLARQYDILGIRRYDLIFIDDVDSILKSSKLFDKILYLLGFNEEIVNYGLKVLQLKRKGLRKGDFSLLEEIEKLQEKIAEYKKNNKIGTLIVSGASLKGRRTKRVKLFMELLDFDVGAKVEGLRNIVDVYTFSEDILQDTLYYVKSLGKGGIVFVSQDKGLSFVKEIYDFLTSHGIRAEAYIRPKRGILKRFREGEVDVLVGIASSRSPLSRGIDLPEVIKYAIFAGVPKIDFSLDPKDLSPAKKIVFLATISEYLSKRERNICRRYMGRLRNVLSVATLYYRNPEAVQGDIKEYLASLLKEIDNFINKKMENKTFLKKLSKSPFVEVLEEEKILKLVISDPVAYIQGSGRTSRLYAGGVSKGLSILLVDDEKAFHHLQREVSRRISDIDFKRIEDIRLDEVLKEINIEREIIRSLLEGKVVESIRKDTRVSLFIVESPNKARTIAWFFGRPSVRRVDKLTVYEAHTGKNILLITATGGHLFDLITTEGIYGIEVLDDSRIVPLYNSIKRCLKCGEMFTDDLEKCPKCGSTRIRDSLDIVKSLRKILMDVDEVLIGTDPDAEGEKIAWDVYLALRPFIRDIKRIEFHEVTPSAILKAIETPRSINKHLVDSQIVRRIEDRWIGFGLSVIVQNKFGIKTLSAGRVQTPVLGWVIDSFAGYRKNKTYIAIVEFSDGLKVAIELDDVKNGWEARRLIEKLKEEDVKIKLLEKKVLEYMPFPPYTTDSLLRDASAFLRLSAEKTMRIAQNLFEVGLITYHRTDSSRVSALGISIAHKYISEKFGEEYYTGRVWGTGKEGAHECIRPTRPIDAEELREMILTDMLRIPLKLTLDHFNLYNLIFRRFIASQMRPVEVEKTSFNVRLGKYTKQVELTTKVLRHGFDKMVPIRVKSLDMASLSIKKISYKRISKVKLLRQGDLIQLMKERGLGRPSTYAKIVNTLLNRRYVYSVGMTGYLVPMKIGVRVYDFLIKSYPDIVSEQKTRELFSKMDQISEGKIEYTEVLKNLLGQLKELKIL